MLFHNPRSTILKKINVFWFKRDLRLVDNEAFSEALKGGLPLLLLYIYEPSLEADLHYSERHWRFIFESIADLNVRLKSHNTEIIIFRNEVLETFEILRRLFSVEQVFSTEETGLKITFDRDIAIAKYCFDNTIIWQEYQNNGVFRGLKNRDTWRKLWYGYMAEPLIKPDFSKVEFIIPEELSEALKCLRFNFPEVDHTMQKGGRTEGKIWEDSFFEKRLEFYSAYISKPELSRYGCSRLSPYFAWGCISIRDVYQRAVNLKNASSYKKQLSAFMSRLRWQAHFIQKFEMEPRIEFEAFNKGYLDLEQPLNENFVEAWKTGQTGFPLVDASIRSVIETGYLNFRMRSMTVSFLVHHLFQHYTVGAPWLARQFLDFEPGIHYAQFQMQAGFTATNTIRIYNPTKNAAEHDSEAVFIKKYIPELAALPPNLAIEPWLITPMEEEMYNFKVGKTYPNPIIDMKITRARALKELYGKRKDDVTKKETQRILDVHTLTNRNL